MRFDRRERTQSRLSALQARLGSRKLSFLLAWTVLAPECPRMKVVLIARTESSTPGFSLSHLQSSQRREVISRRAIKGLPSS